MMLGLYRDYTGLYRGYSYSYRVSYQGYKGITEKKLETT